MDGVAPAAGASEDGSVMSMVVGSGDPNADVAFFRFVAIAEGPRRFKAACPAAAGVVAALAVEHCSAISCHSMLWRDVTLQFVLYLDIVFDVIACT